MLVVSKCATIDLFFVFRQEKAKKCKRALDYFFDVFKTNLTLDAK